MVPEQIPAIDGPLQGVRVLDLTQMLAGPYCTMMLADFGADVVKVEPPSGDQTRGMGPWHPSDIDQAYGGYFQSVNRNKRSVVLDLKTDEGRTTCLELARVADVVVENFRAGVMERLGLSFETLIAANPRLVYASIRGFGDPRTGPSPYVDRPAFDVTAQAMAGFMSITGSPIGPPTKSGPGIGDIFPASLATSGILAALLQAGRTGKGQFVDVAMYDALLSLSERIVYQYSLTGVAPSRQGNQHPIFCPFDLFRTRDGYVSIAALSERQWRDLCKAMDKSHLADDERFVTNNTRLIHADVVREIIENWTIKRTTRDVTRLLAGVVAVGPVQDAAEIFDDPHVAARDMLVQVHPPGAPAPVTIAGQPVKFSAAASGVRTAAPPLGQHTDEVLSQWLDDQHPEVPVASPRSADE